MPTSVRSYLFFSGRCEEAIDFYTKTLGANLEMLMRFKESPVPMPEGTVPPGFDEKVMHATFTIGNVQIMASDGCDTTTEFSGFQLALSVDSEEECDRFFNGLADGGQIVMPLQETFWSPKYGQVTDKFGIGWMVMVTAPEQ